jgi:hypothetical protein
MGPMDDVLREEQVERVYRVTDALLLNRDWVVVPLRGSADGLEMLLPDGKVLLRPAAGPGFEAWYSGLRGRLEGMDLDRALRASRLERNYVRTPASAAPGSGARRYVKEVVPVTVVPPPPPPPGPPPGAAAKPPAPPAPAPKA